jgi:hypothetical protein
MSAACSISAWSRPAQRFVGEQELGLRRERARKLELLQRSGAEAFDARLLQADELQRFRRKCKGFFTGDSRIRAVKSRERDVLQDRELPERPRDLVGAAEAGMRDAVGGKAGDLLAAEAHRARVGLERAGDEVEGRALPEPFGPMRPRISPSATPKETPLTAVKPPKRLVSLETSSNTY